MEPDCLRTLKQCVAGTARAGAVHPRRPEEWRDCAAFLNTLPDGGRAVLGAAAKCSPVWGRFAAAWAELERLSRIPGTGQQLLAAGMTAVITQDASRVRQSVLLSLLDISASRVVAETASRSRQPVPLMVFDRRSGPPVQPGKVLRVAELATSKIGRSHGERQIGVQIDQLRVAGVELPVMVLRYASPSDAPAALRNQIQPDASVPAYRQAFGALKC